MAVVRSECSLVYIVWLDPYMMISKLEVKPRKNGRAMKFTQELINDGYWKFV